MNVNDRGRASRTAAWTLAAVALAAAAPVSADTLLSPKQQEVIARKTARSSPEEKAIIAGWSDARKLAEFFCAPSALAAFRKKEKGADRVSLGPDEAGTMKFVLVGNTRLSGRGTVRTPGHWKGYRFDCVLDPERGRVKSFAYDLDPT